jgi:CheY-like chemotaxis protein
MAAPNEAAGGGTAHRQPGSFCILVVDDEEEITEVVGEMVRTGGYQSASASGGDEALEIYRKQQIDLVLTDLMMPGMNGWQLLRALKQLNSQLPVVVFTGYAPKQGEAMLLNKETDGYLVKPIDNERLQILLKALLIPDNLGRPAEVLVIDDDRTTLKLVQRTLNRRGLYVHAFSDVFEGTQHLRTNTPDMLVVDLQLPGSTGFEICRTVRSDADTALMPILVVTAAPSRENVQKAIELQINGFIAKPFEPKDLAARAMDLLRQAGWRPGQAS